MYRGVDGSVHFLSSTDQGSTLIITDPVLGVRPIRLAGPCRLTAQNEVSVEYSSISAESSISIVIRPGHEPLINELIGICTACLDGSHDYELWPECPYGNGTESDPDVNVVQLTPRSVPYRACRRARLSVWHQHRASASADGPSEVPVRDHESGSVLDLKPAPVPEREPSQWELEAHWGGPAGSW